MFTFYNRFKPLLLLPFFTLCFTITGFTQPNFHWADRLGGTSLDVPGDILADPAGNVYVTGHFAGTIDLDPGAATASFTSAGSNDWFLARYDAGGNFVWAFSLGSSGNQQGGKLAMDQNGNLWVAGIYDASFDADPGPGITTLSNAGGDDIALLRFSPSGLLLWSGSIGGTGNEYVGELSFGAGNDIYLGGAFSNTVDADMGAGVTNLTAVSSFDAFILRWDPAGSLVWARAFGGNGVQDVDGISTNAAGQLFLSGQFYATVDFDPGAGVTSLTALSASSDGYLSRFDTLGNFIWVQRIGGTDVDNAPLVQTDALGHVVLAGLFNETANFGNSMSGSVNLTAAGTTFGDFFVVQYDTSALVQWAFKIGGTTGDDDVSDLLVSADGTVHVSGIFQGTVDFLPGAGTDNLTSAGGRDGFVARYDVSGTHQWSFKAGSTGNDDALSLSLIPAGSLFAGYLFSATVDFNPGAGVSNLTSAGSSDVAVVRYGPCTVPVAPGNTTPPAQLTRCTGATSTLTATGTGTLGWYTASTGGTYLAGGGTFITPVLSGTVTYYVQDSTCVPGSRTAITITVSPPPSVSLGADVNQCGGTLLLDAANPGSTYAWSTGATTQTLLVSTSGTFHVTVTAAGGCTDADTIVVNIFTPPSVSLGTDVNQCGGTLLLDAANPGSTYAWSTGASTQTLLVSASGTYHVTVTAAGGCTDADTIVVNIFTPPSVSLGTDVNQCGGTLLLDAANPGSTYAWSTGATTQTLLVSTSGTYHVTVTAAGGCTDADTIVVNIFTPPSVSLGANVDQCGGTLLLDAANPGSTYSWSTGATTQTLLISTSGTYHVTVTGAGGCTDADTIVVNIFTPPSVSLGADVNQCGGTLLLDAANPGSTYAWSTGTTTQTLLVSTSGTYHVTVTAAGGCTDADTIVVNIFTPPSVVADLGAVDTLCTDDPPLALTGGMPAGGTWSGPGVTAGFFDPAAAGLGNFPLIYDFTDSNGCSSSDTAVIHTQICTQLTPPQPVFAISVFPNPTTDLVYLHVNAPGSFTCRIFNILGTEVSPSFLFEGFVNIPIPLSDLPAGIYLLEVTQDRYKRVIKVIRE